MNKSNTSNTEPRSSNTGEVDESVSTSRLQDSMDIQRLNLDNEEDGAAADINNSSQSTNLTAGGNPDDSRSNNILDSWFELEDDENVGVQAPPTAAPTYPAATTSSPNTRQGRHDRRLGPLPSLPGNK